MEIPEKFTHTDNVKGFLALIRDYGMIFIIASLSIYWKNLFFYFVSIWLIGLLQFDLGEVLLHEASHNHLFKNTKLNQYLGLFYALPFFKLFSIYKNIHMAHHKHLGDPEFDHLVSDYASHGLSNPNKNICWIWFFKPVLGYAGYVTVKAIITRFRKHTMQCLMIILPFWSTLLLIFYSFNALDFFFMYWIVPLFWTFPCFLYWSEIGDHYNTTSGTRSNLSPIHNLICHNNGYHALHHKYPSIPWYYLPQAYDVLKEVDQEIALDVSYGFYETYSQLKAT